MEQRYGDVEFNGAELRNFRVGVYASLADATADVGNIDGRFCRVVDEGGRLYYGRGPIWEPLGSGVASGGGGGGSPTTYTHEQTIAAAVWVVSHNLDKYPSVMLVDSAGTVVMGGIQFISRDHLIVTFSSAFSGRAFLN